MTSYNQSHSINKVYLKQIGTLLCMHAIITQIIIATRGAGSGEKIIYSPTINSRIYCPSYFYYIFKNQTLKEGKLLLGMNVILNIMRRLQTHRFAILLQRFFSRI
jgi:hypothetical protein